MSDFDYKPAIKNILLRLSSGDAIYIEAYDRSVEFFKMLDKLENTSHAENVVRIFGANVGTGISISDIALKNFLSERTLYRYAHKYVNCIMLIVEDLTRQREKR